MNIIMSDKELANIYSVSVTYAYKNRASLLEHYNRKIKSKLLVRHPDKTSNKKLNDILRGEW